MAVVGIRDLSRDTSRIIRHFEETGEPVIVTREGRPIGTLVPVDPRQVEDLVLASTSGFARRDRGMGGEGDGEEHSAAEVARAIGASPPSDEEATETASPREALPSLEQLVSNHLAPLENVFSPSIVPHVQLAATRVVGMESENVLGRVDPRGSIDDDERRRVADLNAALYARLVSWTMMDALTDDPAHPERAVTVATDSTCRDLRAINAEILAGPAPSMEAYEAAIQTCTLFLGRLGRHGTSTVRPFSFAPRVARPGLTRDPS